MKKIYFTFGFAALLFGAIAQQNIAKKLTPSSTFNLPVTSSEAKPAAATLLMPVSVQPGGCATSTTSTGGVAFYSTAQYSATPTYTLDARGYAFGTDVTYLVQALGSVTITTDMCAQKYNVAGTGITVTGVVILAGKARSTNSLSLISAQIYSENATTKAPNTQIGVAATRALSTFTTGPGSPNVLNFTTPVAISAGNFFVAVQSPPLGGANNDSLAILSTKFGCSSTDSLSWVHTVYNPVVSPAKWNSVKSNFNANADILIYPVVDIPTGVNGISKGNLTLLAAFPNPASNEISINFGLNQTSKVEIEIYDVTGKIVNSIKLDNLESGNHTSKVSVANLNAGVYMYSVKSENAKMFSKFTVAK